MYKFRAPKDYSIYSNEDLVKLVEFLNEMEREDGSTFVTECLKRLLPLLVEHEKQS